MFLVNLFSAESIQIMVRSAEPLWLQLLLGSGVGVLMGFIAHLVSNSRVVQASPRVLELRVLFRDLHLSTFDCVLISIAVGFGEELLFRGAIQPLLGVIPTAVLFVAIHGYISFRDWRISVYGVLMTGFIIIIGYMTEFYGIWSAAAAHALIDFVLLMAMRREDEV